MTLGAQALGPFRGFVPYDEGSHETFYGRAEETARLTQLVLTESNRVTALTGEAGVGKTSLLRAGLIPALERRGIICVYLGAYHDIDAEVLRATSRIGGDPPSPNQEAVDYLAKLARESRAGMVLILDHLEDVLTDEIGAAADLGALLAGIVDGGGNRLRLVLSVEESAFARLDQLKQTAGITPTPGAWMTLERLSAAQATAILERTALQTGVFFESGLSSVVGEDFGRGRACRPLDLQLVARAIIDLRLTSVRKYQRSGGATMLPLAFFEHLCEQAGGRPARKVLLEVADAAERGGDIVLGRVESRTRLPRATLIEILSRLKAAGILRSRPSPRGEIYSLAHPALRGPIEDFAVEQRARATVARRKLRRRLNTDQRLRLPELFAVRRHLGAALNSEEQGAVVRSVRRNAIQIGVVMVLLVGLGLFLFADLRRSYTLGFEPPGGGGAARVVVRLGRSSLSFFNFLPNRPNFGAMLADTGFSAAGLVAETADKIAAGKASGTLDAPKGDGRADKGGAVPGWLREVLNGLRPVPRGVAKALLGDPDGVTSLKHAFSDPLARRETLEALAVIGRGRAGEDEILAAALTDSAPEIRRRGVEVAAAIDRRQRNGAHGATLRTALADKSLDVRAAVLRETATLPPQEAAGILTVALRDPDPGFRKQAEDATLALAVGQPAAAAEAVQQVLQSPDGGVRRSGLALLEQIAARSPAACAGALGRLVANEQAPEEARVAALLVLRKAGEPSAQLRPLLEKAVRPEASPRLRAAALPLYARLVDPGQAEEIARAEMKGSPAARAAGAAVWGTVAITRPEIALKPLKALLYDPSTETRLEAARSFAYLKRDGILLCDKALKDPNAEVERAAVESLQALASVNPVLVADVLTRGVKTVRPAVRKSLIEALGRIGETRPAAVLPPLARALKDPDGAVRVAAATAFCSLSRKSAVVASPYLRIAARDDRLEVRAAAAACLGDLADGDPKGAAKMAAELAGAEQPSVRVAAAESLGRLGKAREVTLPALLKLIADPERNVRIAAARSFAAISDAPGEGGVEFSGSKRGGEAERALNAALMQGDAGERRVVVSAAAKAGLVAVLRQATADGDESVRLDAVRAAATLKPPALDVVRGAVDDRSNAVRAEATRILSGASGAGAREVLPIYEAMLRGGDKTAREAAVIGVGELAGAGEAGARLLGEALGQRSESLRTAAARALGRLAEREPDHAMGQLERAVRDPSYDVRSAAIPGLALAWSRKQTAEQLTEALMNAEADSPRRFVALEALVLKAQSVTDKDAARRGLERAASSGPPLARLAARIGESFVAAPLPDLHAFIERLLGG